MVYETICDVPLAVNYARKEPLLGENSELHWRWSVSRGQRSYDIALRIAALEHAPAAMEAGSKK